MAVWKIFMFVLVWIIRIFTCFRLLTFRVVDITQEWLVSKMLRSKVFLKKTKKGGIMKIVREHYLRDDIWCGSSVCDNCEQDKTVLEELPDPISSLCKSPHYIIPDTNVVLHQVRRLADRGILCGEAIHTYLGDNIIKSAVY